MTLNELWAEVDSLNALAKDDGRELSAQELDKMEALLDSIEQKKAEDARREAVAARLAGGKPKTVVTAVKERFTQDAKCGFKSSQDFFRAIAENRGQAGSDDRLKYLASISDSQNTTNGVDGGFAVPEGFIEEQLKAEAEEDPTAALVRNVPMNAPIVKINARTDKNHTTSVVGGIRVYRRPEADLIKSSKNAMEQIVLSVNDLSGLTYATHELLSDSPATVASTLASFPEAFAEKELDERINGTGVGQFEGILNSPALITVAKESGQAAGSLLLDNIAKMRAAAYKYSKCVWMANADLIPQFLKLGGDSAGNGQAIFSSTSSMDIPDMLMGRPLIFSEHAKAQGSAGDLMLVNWSEYLVGEYEGLTSESSIHVRFEYNEEAFKFFKRNDGRGWWRSKLTPKNGSQRSPFIALGARG